MTFHIEITKSQWKEGTWNIRIGDIEGSTESSNISKKEVVETVSDLMYEEKKPTCEHQWIRMYPYKEGQKEVIQNIRCTKCGMVKE